MLTEGVDDLLLEEAVGLEHSTAVLKEFPDFQLVTFLPSLPCWHGDHNPVPSGTGRREKLLPQAPVRCPPN